MGVLLKFQINGSIIKIRTNDEEINMFDSKLNSLLILSVTKSITKTAEIVNLTQPSVTAQIKSLEDEYGIKITKKVGNELIITPEGKILINSAEKIKSAYLNAEKAIRAYKSKMHTLRIGITSGVESNFISHVLTQFALEYNQQDDDTVSVVVLYDTIHKLTEKLQYYTIDLIITDEDTEFANIKKVELDSDQLVLATSTQSPIANLNKISLKEITDLKLIVRLPNSSTRILFDAILRANSMTINDFNIDISLNSVSSIKNLVKCGMADAILSKNNCIKEIEENSIKAIPIIGANVIHNTNIIYLKEFSREDIIDRIIEIYNEYKG